VEQQLTSYLVGSYPIAGVYNDIVGKKMSLLDAYKEKLITRGKQYIAQKNIYQLNYCQFHLANPFLCKIQTNRKLQ